MILIFTLSGLISCSKNSSNDNYKEYEFMKTEGRETAVGDYSFLNPMQKAELTVNFKKDFPVIKNELGIGELHNSFLTKRHGIEEMKQVYPSIKPQLVENIGPYNGTVQTIALRYLRWIFIEEVTEDAMNETSYLLDILVESEAVDLDVMADAYFKVKDYLSKEKNSRYYNYILLRYENDKDFIESNYLTYENIYTSTKDLSERINALFMGKLLERKSKAMLYTKQLLGF